MLKSIEKNLKFILISTFIVATVFFQTFFIVNEKQVAIILQFGKVKRIVNDSGLNAKLPFIQNIIKFDARILDFDANTNEIIASDQRRLLVDAFIKYKIIDAVKVFQTSRNETGVQARLESILDSTIRQVLGNESLQDVLSTKRQKIMDKIQTVANNQAKNFGIEIIDVRIKRTDLPAENSDAVYKRMQSDREKEAREYRAQGDGEYAKIIANSNKEREEILANANKKAEIIKGAADAKVIEIFAKSYGRDRDFFNFYRTMQSHQEFTKNKKLIMNFNNEYFKYLSQSSQNSSNGNAK